MGGGVTGTAVRWETQPLPNRTMNWSCKRNDHGGPMIHTNIFPSERRCAQI
jgi:hypothetical protein